MIGKLLSLLGVATAVVARAHKGSHFLLAFILLGTVGCESQFPFTLMPTPVVYQQGAIDPFAHLADGFRTTEQTVFYATNRSYRPKDADTLYGNSVDNALHLGTARVHLGRPDTDWSMLVYESLNHEIDDAEHALPLSVQHVSPLADVALAKTEQPLSPAAAAYFEQINTELAVAVDKEIMVYVHGAKVGFNNVVALAGEVDHFAGRDFVALAFSWPSHQNIVSYLMGIDVQHALSSSEALASLLALLAEHTTARHINVISYSAGGRVVSKALKELRDAHAELNPQQLQARFRIGAVVFAAADVSLEHFFERLPAVSAMSNQVVLTVSDADDALAAAKRYMGGGTRVGQRDAELQESEFVQAQALDNVEVIDVSIGQEGRGFDIIGHHYWYRHPWMSSDVIFLMRTDLPATRRGLEVDQPGIWYLPVDYPERIRKAAHIELDGEWGTKKNSERDDQ